jgi:FlaG/FlaF family flagellin (archaellin)
MRGVSPVVSFVLIVAIVITTTMAAYIWASDAVKSMNEPGRIKSLINQFIALDQALKQTAHGDINFTNLFELYYPEGFLELRPGTDSLNYIFVQQARVLGYTPEKQVMITWTTDEASNSTLNYGESTSLGTILTNSSYVTVHSITITTELHPYVTYYYNITSCDVYANCLTNGTYTFEIS